MQYTRKKPNKIENSKIYLNGLSIEILDKNTNDEYKIKLSWNDYDITKDVRWCGDIVLNEKVIVKDGAKLILDLGLTPTQPVNPILFKNNYIFTEPTILKCNKGSELIIEPGAQMLVKRNS